MALGDSDNDGDLDLLVTGVTPALVRVGQLWLNNGTGTFSHASQVSLTPVANRCAKWIDIEGDGDLDIFINGQADGRKVSHLFRNDGNNVFVKLADQISAVSHGDVDVMDYNGDGDLDILVSGDKGSTNYATEVWDNNGGGSFSLGSTFTGVAWSSVQWLDINKDQMRDAIVTGMLPNGQRVTEIWCFVPGLNWLRVNLGVGLAYSDVSTGDIDNDGDLDILITGNTGSTFATFILKNVTTWAPNSAPITSSRPTVRVTGCGRVNVDFLRTGDGEQSPASLTYSMRIGTASAASNIRSGHALTNGYRTVGGHGYIIHGGGTFPVTNLAPGNYFVSVQAIDMNGLGGPWSVERQFTVPAPPSLSSATSRSVCTGTPFTYTATSIVSGIVFNWSRGTVAGISNAAVVNASGASIAETLVNTTSSPIIVPYTIQLTTTYGCVVTSTLNVTVNPSPRNPVLSHTANSNECAGNVVTVNNMIDYPGGQVAWAGGQTGDMYVILAGPQTVQPTITSAAGCTLVGPAISIRGKNSGGWLGRNTNWHDFTNWCGGLPNSSFNAVFEAADQVMPIITSRASINNITLPTGKTLTVMPGTELVMFGNKTGAGTLDLRLGSVLEMRGSGNQYLDRCEIPNLLIESQGTVTIGPGVRVHSVLDIRSGAVVSANPGTSVLKLSSNMSSLNVSTPATVTVPMALTTLVGTGPLNILGLQLSAGQDNLDTVYVERTHTAISALGNTGIGCTWRVRAGAQPINGRQLTLSWSAALTAGKRMNALQVWRRPDNATAWLKVGGVQNRTAFSANPSITVNTNSFSDWTVSDQNTPLPVTWLALHALAKEHGTTISWTTAQEVNNAGFTVQYSLEGSTWQDIAFVVAGTKPGNAQQYSHEDVRRTFGYYRIRQQDLDGTETYSPTVAVKSQNTMLTLSLLPNPAQDLVQIVGLLEPEEVLVFDAQGKLQRTALAQPDKGLELNGLAAGVYTLKCKSQVLRLVKE